MNRLVARRTLEAWGVEVTEACDGQEALDVIAEAAGADALFDLVLMDLQMPGLDGVEATRRIRADLGLPSERLPVLALTASVLAYQQADVLGAGLDDFLLKPFAPDVLRARIAAHAGRAPAAPEAADGAPLDLQALSLYTLGDADLMDRVVTLFFTDGRQAIEAMASAASTGDPGLLEASAHSLKAQAGYVGAAALSHTADRIVNAVRAGEAEGIADEVRLALRQYRTAADELRRLYPRDRGEAPRADDRVPRQAEPESARPPAA